MCRSQSTVRSAAMAGTERRIYLTLAEVAERYRKTEATIRYWRHIGYGPKGAKVGTGVLYPIAEVEAFDRELADQARAGVPDLRSVDTPQPAARSRNLRAR